jgi:hypothetical protein
MKANRAIIVLLIALIGVLTFAEARGSHQSHHRRRHHHHHNVHRAARTAKAKAHGPHRVQHVDKVVEEEVNNKAEPVSVGYKIPLYVSGDADDFYQIPVAVGNPPQFFNLTLLTEHMEIGLLGKGLQTNVYAHCKVGSEPQRNYYDVQASKTAKPWQNIFFFGNNWMDGEPLVDDLACSNGYDGEGNSTNDVVQVCAAVSNKQQCVNGTKSVALDIAVMRELDEALNPKWTADGYFGLDPTQKLEDTDVASFDELISSLSYQRYSIALMPRPLPYSTPQLGGWMMLGGTLKENCDGNWFTIGGDYYDQYVIGIDGYSFGNTAEQYDQGIDAFHTMSTAFLHVSSAVLNTIVITLNAEYDFNADRYFLDCSATKTAPNLGLFTTAGTPLSVPPKDYIRQFPKNDKCVIMFTDEDLPIGSEWYLGTTLLGSYCMRYDNDQTLLQFSKRTD